jgi:hypothetical protein
MHGADHPKSVRSRDNSAMSYLAEGRPDKAIPLLERRLAYWERVMGPDHQSTLRSRINLATGYRAAGRTVEAILLLERTLADCERVLGADHPDTKVARDDLAALTGEPDPRELLVLSLVVVLELVQHDVGHSVAGLNHQVLIRRADSVGPAVRQ